MVCKQPVQLQCFPKQNPNLTVLKSTSSAMLLNTQLHRQKITIPNKCPSSCTHTRRELLSSRMSIASTIRAIIHTVLQSTSSCAGISTKHNTVHAEHHYVISPSLSFGLSVEMRSHIVSLYLCSLSRSLMASRALSFLSCVQGSSMQVTVSKLR